MTRILFTSFLALLSMVFAIAPGRLPAQEPADVATELGRLQATAAPTRFNDFQREIGADETNAARILDPLRQKWLAIDIAVSSLFVFDDEQLSTEFLEAWDSVAAERLIVFEAVEQAVNADVWLPRLNFEPESAQEFIAQQQENIQSLRSLARVLQYRSRVQLNSGDTDAAAMTALQLVKLSRLHPRFGLMGCMTCNVIQQMGLSSLGEVLQDSRGLSLGSHRAIEAELEQHDSLDAFTDCLMNERVIGVQMLKDQGFVGLTRVESYLKAMRLAIDKSRNTMGQQPDLLDPQEHGVTGAMLDPGLSMVRGSLHRGLAMVRCLRIANWLRSSMIDEPVLDKIDLPIESKSDPFIDKPLVLRETGDGILIYSLGRNRLDDGGEFANDQDIGFQLAPDND